MDGTITGEHGVGLKKRENLVDELGDDTINAMRKVSLFQNDETFANISQLKQAYDPYCLLNCDKIIQMDMAK